MVGSIPTGFQIDHRCHNEADCAGGTTCPHRLCVNWAKHLVPVTAQANLLASKNTLNAINISKTHCPHGHPYDEQNTAVRSGRRHCRQCDRDRRRRNYYANVEAERSAARDRQRRRRSAPVSATGAQQA
jgi:hypothetical protein